MPLYSPRQAAIALGISPSAIRNYTNTYSRHLSTEATSNPRRLTESDLRVIGYVVSKTATGLSHDRVLALLATEAGQQELAEYAWEVPEDEAEPEPSTALVPLAQLQAAQALMLDAQRREHDALQREQELQAKINELMLELGKAQGELVARKSGGWWARLFGS
jgi:DNA-binding transcriptional MerR regulator